jgi:hypothetical protein
MRTVPVSVSVQKQAPPPQQQQQAQPSLQRAPSQPSLQLGGGCGSSGSSGKTTSGFAKRSVCRALTEAIRAGATQRACGLALELLSTPEEKGPLIARLVDAYAECYVSVDGSSLPRISKACHMLAIDPLPASAVASSDATSAAAAVRRTLFVIVVALSCGLPRQADGVAACILRSARAALASCRSSRSGASVATEALSADSLLLQIRGGRCAQAVTAANAALLADRHAEVWDACVAGSRAGGSADVQQYVAQARALYYQNGRFRNLPLPPKPARKRRVSIALCAVLVASAAASDPSAPLPQGPWGPHIELAVDNVCSALSVAGDAGDAGDADADAGSRRAVAHCVPCEAYEAYDAEEVEEGDEEAGDDGAGDVGEVQQISYLRLFTAYDYDAAAAVSETRRANHLHVLDTSASKAIRLKPTTASAASAAAAAAACARV